MRVAEVGPVGDAVHAARVLRDHRVADVRKLAVLKHQEVCARAGALSAQSPPRFEQTDGRGTCKSHGTERLAAQPMLNCTDAGRHASCRRARATQKQIEAMNTAQKTSRFYLTCPVERLLLDLLLEPHAQALRRGTPELRAHVRQGAPCLSASLRSSAPIAASQLLKMSTCVLKTQISEPTWRAHIILLCCF